MKGWPGRLTNVEAARGRYGDLVDRYAPYLMQGDPLADELVADLAAMPPGRGRQVMLRALDDGVGAVRRPPASLVRFFDDLERVPVWVDWEKLERGGRVFLRSGVAGIAALTCYALPLSYASPAGTKPLVRSGQLVQRAARRMSETARYIVETCRPGGLCRGGDGFKIAVRVRLMHAQVRRLLVGSGGWPLGEWGVPINQADMAGTNILFSVIMLDGLRRLGARITRRDADDVIQLWRYAGVVMGVDERLCVASEAEGARLRDVIQTTQHPPDDDSRALVKALLGVQRASIARSGSGRAAGPGLEVLQAVSRQLLGDALADGLGYPKTPWRHAMSPLRVALAAASVGQRLVPGARLAAQNAGLRAWEGFIEEGLAGLPATFALPVRLPGLASGGDQDDE